MIFKCLGVRVCIVFTCIYHTNKTDLQVMPRAQREKISARLIDILFDYTMVCNKSLRIYTLKVPRENQVSYCKTFVNNISSFLQTYTTYAYRDKLLILFVLCYIITW